MLVIPFVIRVCPGSQIGKGKDREGQTRKRPGEQCPAEPLTYLPHVVRTGDVFKKTVVWDLVGVTIGFTEFPEFRIGLDIDHQTGKKENDTYDESGVRKP